MIDKKLYYLLIVVLVVMVGILITGMCTDTNAQDAPAATGFDPTTVTVKWDPNEPTPDGYRVFKRELPNDFDRANPVYEGPATEAKITGLELGKTYGFIVIAYEGNRISADSDQVIWTPSDQSKEIIYPQQVGGIIANRVTVNVTIE
jgi:hypothetical protein